MRWDLDCVWDKNMTEPKHSGQSEAVQLYNDMVVTGNSNIDPNRSASKETTTRICPSRANILTSLFWLTLTELELQLNTALTKTVKSQTLGDTVPFLTF